MRATSCSACTENIALNHEFGVEINIPRLNADFDLRKNVPEAKPEVMVDGRVLDEGRIFTFEVMFLSVRVPQKLKPAVVDRIFL